MTEKEYPRIEVAYKLDREDRKSSLAVVLAGNQYAEGLRNEEAFKMDITTNDELMMVVFGRNVLGVMSYAEINHEADEMQQAIDENIVALGSEDLLPHIHAGVRPTGNLPEPE